MPADGRVDAAGRVRMGLDQRAVERFAHAVQALELVILDPARPLHNGGDGQRVVGRELREQARTQAQQLVGAGQVVEVRHRLAGEDGVVVEPALLGALDLGVPIRALDETHHETAVEPPGEVRQKIDHDGRALLVGLDREPEAAPAGQRRSGECGGDHVERQFEAVRLLGVDGEIQVISLGGRGEFDDARHEFAHDARAAHRLVAGVEGRELDRDAGPVGQGGVAGRPADGLNGSGVGVEVARRVRGRARALAQHVEGVAVEPPSAGVGAAERVRDRLAEHEMVAHDAHGLTGGGAQGRHAEAFGERFQEALGRLARLDDPRRDAKRPGGGVDEKSVRRRGMVDEVPLAELVLDQPVGGGGVRYAQQRLGQDHEGEALLGGERVLAQHVLDAAKPAPLFADRLDQARRGVVDAALALGRERRFREQTSGDGGVVLGVGRVEDGQGRGGHGHDFFSGALHEIRSDARFFDGTLLMASRPRLC